MGLSAQVTWPKEEPWVNGGTIKARGSCGLVVRRITSNGSALKAGVITTKINAKGVHLDRRIAIQWEWSDAFYNAYPCGLIQALHEDRTVTI